VRKTIYIATLQRLSLARSLETPHVVGIAAEVANDPGGPANSRLALTTH